MKIWILGLKGSRLGYVVYYDSFIDGKIHQNNEANILKLDVVNKSITTDKGQFDIIDNYREFLGLEEK